jgi:hypothetical protein
LDRDERKEEMGIKTEEDDHREKKHISSGNVYTILLFW